MICKTWQIRTKQDGKNWESKLTHLWASSFWETSSRQLCFCLSEVANLNTQLNHWTEQVISSQVLPTLGVSVFLSFVETCDPTDHLRLKRPSIARLLLVAESLSKASVCKNSHSLQCL